LDQVALLCWIGGETTLIRLLYQFGGFWVFNLTATLLFLLREVCLFAFCVTVSVREC
jgi:hypothetical protein